jgi:hypothetical protein
MPIKWGNLRAALLIAIVSAITIAPGCAAHLRL